MIKKSQIFLYPAIFLCTILFSSCGGNIVLKPSGTGAEFTITLNMGNAFLETLAGISEIPSSNISEVFDCNEIVENLEDSDFQNVFVQIEGINTLKITGFFEKNSENPFIKSRIVEFAPDGDIKVHFSPKNFQDLYKLLPQDFKNYIDMFMSPSFTNEKMTDNEYTDLIASVYGENLTEEIKSGAMKFEIFEKSSKTRKNTLSLLNLLNMTSQMEI